jgi:hypothetical protein
MIFKRKTKNTFNLEFVRAFFTSSYQQHNIARLSHLDSLGLDLQNKSVFEFGAGVGDHTYFYLLKKCLVTASDSRAELVEFISQRFGVGTLKLDVEKDLDTIVGLDTRDIFHCYGLLYHVSNPRDFLMALNGKCRVLLLETCVSNDFREDGPHVIAEDSANPTQASSGKGCRPTRRWIFETLKNVFPYVYVPQTQPDHTEFPKDWNVEYEDRSKLIRAVFIASQNQIDNVLLSDRLLKVYK